MSRARKIGLRSGTVLTALLLVAAFLAGSATYLAVKDAFSPPEQAEVDPSTHLLMPQQPALPLTPPYPNETETQPNNLPEDLPPDPAEPAGQPPSAAVSAAPPEVASPQQTETEPSEPDDAVQVAASADTPVKLLFVKPVEGAISKGYSDGTLVYSQTLGDYRTHRGCDMAAPVGTKVRAMADGEVTDLYKDDLQGSVIEITHEDGSITRYCNLQNSHMPGIKAGAKVKMGDVISAVGDTTLAEAGEQPHLHLEAYRKGEAIDPVTLFS